eukprot:1044632-Amphidinium_carterae.1
MIKAKSALVCELNDNVGSCIPCDFSEPCELVGDDGDVRATFFSLPRDWSRIVRADTTDAVVACFVLLV